MNSIEKATITEALSKSDSSSANDETTICSCLLSRLSRAALGAVLVLLILFALLPRDRIRLEDAQTVLFPLMLILVWRIIKPAVPDQAARIPGPLLACGLVFWGISAVHVRGYIPHSAGRDSIYLARLSNDPRGEHAHKYFSQYNHIAETYRLPRMRLLQRSFKSEEDARVWLERNPGVSFVLTGDAKWFRITPASLKQLFGREHGDRSMLTAGLHQVALDLAEPGGVQISNEPRELAQHFLAWFACALSRDVQSCAPAAPAGGDSSKAAARRRAFEKALSIRGHWRSNSPLALAAYYAATYQALVAPNGADLSSALKLFASAAQFSNRREVPELTAAVFNNAAVSLLTSSTGPQEYKKATAWLNRAVRSGTMRKGRRTAAAKTAEENLKRIRAAQLQLFTASLK